MEEREEGEERRKKMRKCGSLSIPRNSIYSLKISSPLKKDGAAVESSREMGGRRPKMMEEKGGKGMAPQGAVRGHLKRVRGMGKVEELRMTP